MHNLSEMDKLKMQEELEKTSNDEQIGSQLEVLSFKIGSMRFGLEIKHIQEIIKMVEIAHLPDGPTFVEGIINLRSKVVPIFNLADMCGCISSEAELLINQHIIIVQIEKVLTGIVVDKVDEVLMIDTEGIENPSDGEEVLVKFLMGVAKLDDGLMFILDLNKMFDLKQKKLLKEVSHKKIEIEDKESSSYSATKDILHKRAVNLSKTGEGKKDTSNDIQLLSFCLGEEWFGVKAIYVREILLPPVITKIPFVHESILGIINLRGEIVAVMDIKKPLDLPGEGEKKLNDPKIIIIEIQKKTLGFWVDGVGGIITYVIQSLLPPMSGADKTKADFIEGQIESDEEGNKIISILNLDKIINYDINVE